MGSCTVKELTSGRIKGRISLCVLARRSKVNEKKLSDYISKGVKVIWGDLENYEDVAEGVSNADIVLHVGGMVSPAADWFPEKTLKVNTTAMKHIIKAAQEKERSGGKVQIVYIGSVSQYGNRAYPVQWGRAGDPINVATFDKYALSKCLAERMLSESGLKEWVSLRQTGIMYPGILMKASDPIAFHVPMATGLEWISSEASGRLLAAICEHEPPKDFWKGFYNIGGGEAYRFNNYEYMKEVMNVIGCPSPEKAFGLNWFATRNFHGMFYQDSDELEKMFHFRDPISFHEYMLHIKKELPFFFGLAPLVPAIVIKTVMKRIAGKRILGPLWWISHNETPRIEAAFGGIEEYKKIPGWDKVIFPDLKEKGEKLNHGYDENKSFRELTLGDLRKAAIFRGGKCNEAGDENKVIDPDAAVEWECNDGHIFRLTPRTVLKGGHWCEKCLRLINEDSNELFRQAKTNLFLRQVAGEKIFDEK